MKRSDIQMPFDPPYGERAESSPTLKFSEWYGQAKLKEKQDVSAVCLATATRCGAPSCRMVLLKDFSESGFTFYTNAQSRKGCDIDDNPQAAMCFYWPECGLQIRVEGFVTNLSDTEADAYFNTRPLKSRIGAWASQQSRPLKDRSELMKRIAFYSAKWATGNVERPPYWKGFRIVPDYFEFWGNGAYRIHERHIYYLRDDDWYEAMLQP